MLWLGGVTTQEKLMLGRLKIDVVGTAAFLYLTFWRHSTITMRL